ncbi:MAG: competence protein ComK [Bacilli bacterium]|nr:competence protein ComK [Bacilli bacterium]
MIKEYEITTVTLAIVPISKNVSRIYEKEKDFIVEKNSFDIIDGSCKFFGSSYTGRFEGTKNLVGYNYKAPIIIEESRRIIFFPTASPRQESCCWISLNNIKDYNKLLDKTKIIFNNAVEIILDVSFFSLESQILRSTRLSDVLQKKMEKI